MGARAQHGQEGDPLPAMFEALRALGRQPTETDIMNGERKKYTIPQTMMIRGNSFFAGMVFLTDAEVEEARRQGVEPQPVEEAPPAEESKAQGGAKDAKKSDGK